MAAMDRNMHRARPRPRSAGFLLAACLFSMLSWSSGQPATAADDRTANIPLLIERLSDFDVEKRLEAAKALGEVGPAAEAAVPALIEALEDWHWDVREIAVRALGEIGPEADAAVPFLLAKLRATATGPLDDEGVVDALGKIGGSAVPALIDIIERTDDENDILAWRASSALTGAGAAAAAVPALITAMQHQKALVRSMVISTLGEIGKKREYEVAPTLIAALDDADAQVRLNAARRLMWIGEFDHAERGFRAHLEESDPDIRLSAISGLEWLSEEVNIVLADVHEALQDDVVNVRVHAARVIWKLDERADLAVPVLIQALNDESARIRSKAINVLIDIGDSAEAAIPALIDVVRGEDPDIRPRAAYALGEFGARAKTAVPPLLSALQPDDDDPDSALYSMSVRALNKIDPNLFSRLKDYAEQG